MAESVMDSNELGLQEWPAEEALDRFLSELEFHKALRRPEHETLPLDQSLKRITSRSVAATMDSPHYYSAAIDGLLVRSAETFTATRDHPAAPSITSGRASVSTAIASTSCPSLTNCFKISCNIISPPPRL